MTVKLGEVAPDFTLPIAGGKSVQLYELLRKGPVVLYFYPKDETLGCTAQACSFRDTYPSFRELQAEVVGISSDSPESHASFAEHHRLPFLLASDREGTVRKVYGVRSTFGLIPGRVTFLIDTDRVVRHVFSSQLNATRHVTEALNALQRLRK